MSDLYIGISGIQVALKALEVVGNNLANAATEGYHRQEVVIEALPSNKSAGVQIGGGALVAALRRQLNDVVEKEILRQQPLLAGVSQELDTLESVEGVFGDLSSKGLGTSLDEFFNVLSELATQPTSPILRDQVVWAADSVAIQFHNISDALTRTKANLDAEASNLVDQVNNLTSEVADCNGRIRELYYRGAVDNNLLDSRDQAVSRLTELLGVQVTPYGDGTVSLMAGGTALVIRDKASQIALGHTPDGNRCLTLAGAENASIQIDGGRLGATLNLINHTLPDLLDNLNTLAREIIQGINQVHVQGVGTAGSFDQLEGWRVNSGDLSAWDPPLTNGVVQVRITNTATGVTVRRSVAVDPSTDTLDDVAARFEALDGVKASVIDSRLRLEAESGYRFDFSAALLPQPSSGGLTGAAQPTLSGAYAGTANQALTFTVVGAGGDVGVTDGLVVRVTNESGDLLATLNVGLGYAAGDALDVADGIHVAFSAGDLKAGETFGVDAIADADTSDFLAGAGLNAFFRGNSAANINIMDDLRSSSARLATAAGADTTDNVNARRMAAVGDTARESLDGATPGDCFLRIVTGVGQQVSLRQGRRDGFDQALQQLSKQRDEASGVDINDEAAQLLIYQQLFQSMAKYMTAVDQSIQTLFAVVTSS
jgi:flagellar hook-associated protein 1 FlgK